MKEILTEMLKMQDKLQVLAMGSEWRKTGADFPLAIAQECAEGMDHLGWKWWKKQEPNIPAAQVEVIDILHFALSAEIHYWQEWTFEEIAENIMAEYRNREAPFWLDDKEYAPKHMTAFSLFRLIGAHGAMGHRDMGLVLLLGEKLGMTFKDMSALYRGKVALNTFRQKNGDRDGIYWRKWFGREDNDWMQEMSADIDWSQPNAGEVLYAALERTYEGALRAR